MTLRACGFSTDTGLGAFATLPLAKELTGEQYSFAGAQEAVSETCFGEKATNSRLHSI